VFRPLSLLEVTGSYEPLVAQPSTTFPIHRVLRLMSSNALSAGRHLSGVADLERLEYRAERADKQIGKQSHRP
jgi:hypothetical protein